MYIFAGGVDFKITIMELEILIPSAAYILNFTESNLI